MTVQYFKEVDPDGTVSMLARIREESDGLYPEYLHDGRWIEAGWVMNYIIDPLAGEPISEREAREIERTRGHEL
jgi:hypothetical protein